MALKNFNEQKFRKKDGMPYGFKADRASSIQEQQIDDAELQRNDYENRIAEARKARNNPSMQRLLASDEYQQKQREYSQRAIELAKANAGDDRITAYKKPQTVSDYSGLGTLPTYSGMNTAANGADIDYTEVNKKAAENGKGWKGFGNSNEETISQEEALKNATRTVEPYIKDKEVKQILDRYVEVSNAHDQAKATSGLRWFKNIDKAVWGSTLDEPKQQLIEKTGLSDEEADKLLRHYKYYANNQLHEEQRKAIDELPTSAKVALTPLASLESITGNFLGGIAVKDSDTKDPELGRDYNSASFGFRNLGNDIKESLHEDINESNLADWQKTALNKGYDVGTMAGESFVTALYPGKVGLLSYGTGSYADNLQEAENRGLTKGQAQTYATTMGIAEVATEAIPFNHLSNLIKNGAGKDAVKGSLKPVFKEVLVQMNEEGTEELANDVIDVIADSLINQDKSKLNISINNYMAEGLSKDEATSKAYKDIALQAADDYLTGALSGGLSAGAAVGVYTGQTTSIGRDIAKNNEYLTKDTESPYYISENKEDYDSDASYEQAQATRQELISAADKLANKQKISGQEARAIYQDTTDVLENKRIQTENRAQRAAVEKIEAATTPLELETAIEKARVNTEAVQQAAETKKTELKMNGAKEEDFANAITPQRALEQGRNGQEISEALLKELPEETQIAYQYGKISHDLNIGKDISKADVTDVWIEDAKNKRQQIEQVKYNNKGQLTFVTNQGVEVSAYDANYSDKGEQLYKSENGILSLQDPELIKIAIDAEAAGKHDYPIASLTKAIKTMDTLGRTQGVDFNSAIKSSGYQYMESVVGREVLEQAFNAHKDISETFDEAKKTGAVKAGKGVVTTRTEENAEAYDRQFDNEDIAAFINTENRNRQSIRGTKKIVNDAAEAERVFEDLSDVQKLFLESFSKKAKVDFNFIYTKEGETRGAYQPEAGKIILNLAYGNDMFEVALHEGIGEFLQAHNAEDYNKITSSILNYYASTQTDELAENIRAYQNAYKNKHYRESFNELANDAMAKIFSTDEGLTELINWLDINETAEQAKTVKKTFLDYFKDFKQMIADIIKNGGLKNESLKELNIAKDQAADYAKQLTKAMSKAVANRDAQVNQEGQSSTRKSIKLSEVEFDADGVPVIQSNIFTNAELKNFRQLNNTIKAELQTLIGKQLTISSDNRVVDIAGDFAKEYTGSNDTWNNRAAIRKAKANAISGIKQIVESATNPQWMENTEDKHESDAKRGWTYYDVNFGIKGADSINYYTGILNVRMDEDGKDYLYDITLIRKRNVPLTRSDSTQNVPTKDIITSESQNTTGKISKNSEESVNNARKSKSIVDTEGRSLTKEQQEFYSDEHPAFIENGALKTYYHGTKHAGFTTFSLNRMDDKQSIFFTDNKDVAQTYSGVAEMFEPDKEWSFDELAAAIENVTNGDWELKKVDAGYELVEYEVDNDKTSKFKSLKDAQSYFIDYMNNQDFISKDSAANYKVYLHATNPLVVDAKGAEWNNLPATNFARHITDVTIQSNSGEYQVDYAEKGKYKQEIFDSLKELEKKFGRFPEGFGFGELYFTDLYLDKNNNKVPTNTREYADYAKNNGYDSLVINNVIDTDIYGDAINKTSQIAVVFNPNQVKSVYNENPTSDADIRKSIKVDWDNQVIDIPARTFNDDVFFSGTDEEIADAEKQEVTIKAYYANLMDSKGFRGFTFSFKDGRGDMQERILTRSTREGVDWQYSKRRNGLPVGHDNYINENDDIYSYAIWPNNTLAALYNELLADTPKDGQRVYVIREGAAEEARKSVKVFGESSPYAESIKQTEYVSQVLSTLNNQLKGTSVSMKYLDETVKYIMDKYQANLNTEDLKMELAQFIGYMTTQENVDYNQMMNYLLNIGDEVIEASQLKDPESVRIYDKLKKEVSSYKIRLTKAERKELISRFGGEWKTAFGKLNQVGIKLDNKNGQVMDAGIYQALSEKFRQVAGVYLDESTTPVDQIATIIDAMDALSPSLYEWDGANKMDKALDVATTIIDRYYSMASSIKESNIVKGTEKGNAAIERAKQAEIKKLRAKQAEYKNKLNEEFQALVEDKKKMLQEQQEFYRKQAAIEKKFKGEQKAFNKKVDMSEKELAKTARVMAKMEYQGIKDTEAKRKQKENIVRTSTRLINWMNKPTDARHVPTFLKPALTDMIKAIDFMPASMRKGDDGTISAKKWQDSMQKLQLVIKSLENVESENDSDKYQLSVVMQVEDIVNNMDELLRKNGGIADISKMSKEDLKTLSDIMTSISRAISQMNESFMNKRFSHISGAAKASMNEMDELKPYDEKADVGKDTFGDFLNIEMLEPISFFEELGKASESIMQEFFDGEKIGIEIIKEADTFFDNLSKELKVSKKNLRTWQEDVKPYTIDGVKLYLTSADIMSLYCSYKRELKDQEERPTEATHHIAAGGIKGYRQRIKFTWYNRNPRVAHATQADVLELINSLTEAQQAYADKVVEYMSTTLAEHGNETSNKLNGYSKFLGKYYFPLKTDNNAIATNESNNMSDNVAFRRLINQSFTKSQLDKADNALVLMNFFDVVTEHITGMSNYCAYSMPISDALRWYNYTETERENTDIENEYQRTTVSVKGSMDRVKGDGARKYFEQFIRDVNLDNKPTGTKLSKLITQGLTGFAKAKAVGLNIRVILQQPCAIVRAADVIEGKYLATGWAKMSSNPKKACDYAQNTNWLAYWKSKGMSDTRVSQSMKEIITGSNSKRQDIVEKTGVLAGWADDITWASMYYAAEAKIKATTNLEGEEYRTAVDELYSDIINHTQVIDSQLRKTGTMRSKSELEILANAFKKEPQKSYNMLHRKWWNLQQANYTGANVNKAKKEMHKALTIFMENAFLTAIAQSLVDAWRDDDEEEKYLVKLLHKMYPYESYQAILDFIEVLNDPEKKTGAKQVWNLVTGVWGGTGNVIDNANLFSSMPYVADINSFLQGYQVTRLDNMSLLNQIKNSMNALSSSTATPYSITYALAQLIGYGTGVGADNALKDLRGIYNQFAAPHTGVYIDKSSKRAEQRNKEKNTARATEVFNSNDLKAIDAEIVNTYNKAIESGKDESQSWGAARTMLKEQYKRQFSEHPEQAAALNNRYATLVSKTKHKVSGNYEYYTVEQAQKKFIDDWYEDMTN